MLSTDIMLNVIRNTYFDDDTIVIIDSIKYLIQELMTGETTIDATECCFASIHKSTGKLTCIIYHGNNIIDNPHTSVNINILREYIKFTPGIQSVPIMGAIYLRDYLLAIPGIERLYDGDLEVIANVKRVMESFCVEQRLFHNKMMGNACTMVPCPVKACRN